MQVYILLYLNPYNQSSASANRLLSLIEGLQTVGAQIHLLIYGGYTSASEKAKFGIAGTINNIDYEYVLPLLIEGYWKIRLYKYIVSYIRSSKVINYLIRFFKNKEGIIWTEPSYLNFRFALKYKISQKGKAKLFIEMSEFLDIHRYNKGNFLQRWEGNLRQKIFERKAFFDYDGIALMTKTLLMHYQNFPKPHPKFLHLPMTVDLDRFSGKFTPLPEFERPYVVFIGVMNDAKDGVNILIKAFALIADKFIQYKLYLVGPWNYDTIGHLKMINELGLNDRVFWMKEYPREKIPNIICNAELLVMPRPNSKQAQGGFPTKLGEYLASGKPVCATTVGELPDYLVDGESIFFAEPGSVESFANAIYRALSNPEEALRVGLKGKEVAEVHFNNGIQAKMLYDFLLTL